MATSDLTPEQFQILFGDSLVAPVSGDAVEPATTSADSALTDEEYMILFGDTMQTSLDETTNDETSTDEQADEEDNVALEVAEPDTVEHDAAQLVDIEPEDTLFKAAHAAIIDEAGQTDFRGWTAPLHSAPLHLAPQHSADIIADTAPDYEGLRFTDISEAYEEPTEGTAELSTKPTAAEEEPTIDETATKAPIPESIGLVNRMVSRVKQRLADEIDSGQ